MEETVQDVNQPAEEPSSPVQTESNAPAEPSAETLNADTAPEQPEERGPIPYERFKEVNDKLKELQQAQESQDWVGYQRLKTALDNDPKFAEHFVKNVQGYYQPRQEQEAQPKEDPLSEYPNEIAEPLRRTQQLEQTVQQLQEQNIVQQQQNVRAQYVSRFNELIAKNEVPDHWKSYYEQEVELEAGRMNPDALMGYDPKIVEKAFDAVHQRSQALERNIRGSYRVEKQSDRTPASTSQTGTPGRETPRLKNSEDRASMAAELLKASMS